MSKNRKPGVNFQDADAGKIDKKYEGYSNLKGKYDQQQKKVQKSAHAEMAKGLEDDLILNLQKQIVVMEHEIKLLKEREVDQKNKASGYETLLRDGIPLNEHFLALKNKFNNEQDLLKKNVEAMMDEIIKEEAENKKRQHNIEILKKEYDNVLSEFKNEKEKMVMDLKKLETQLFTEEHTKNVLKAEKDVMFSKVMDLKQDNTSKSRILTKEKYHNKTDAIEKDRRKAIDDIQAQVNKVCDEIEAQQAELEKEQERNSQPEKLLKVQKEITMNLRQDHNKIQTDISVAENRIKDLDTRQTILNNTIQDILKEKRKIDKRNMELEDKLQGRNVTDEMNKMQHKNEERKMRIKSEKNVDTLQKQGEILMVKIEKEETVSKDVLEQKLNLQTELQELEESLKISRESHKENRDDLIKLQVKNSQLTSQNKSLDEEEKDLKEANEKLIAENDEIEKANNDLKKQIHDTIQRIDINNLLKEIDIEELQMISKNNKVMNTTMENLITKWNYIV